MRPPALLGVLEFPYSPCFQRKSLRPSQSVERTPLAQARKAAQCWTASPACPPRAGMLSTFLDYFLRGHGNSSPVLNSALLLEFFLLTRIPDWKPYASSFTETTS